MEMNWEKYNLQICHLLILQFPFFFAVGTETGVLVFPVRLSGSQFYCHSSTTVRARKMSFLSGVRGILWKHFTLPKLLIWIWSSCWYESCDFSDFRSEKRLRALLLFFGVLSLFCLHVREACVQTKTGTVHGTDLKELNFVPSLTLFPVHSKKIFGYFINVGSTWIY